MAMVYSSAIFDREHRDFKPFDIAWNTPKAYSSDVFMFIESSIFERVLPAYLDDDEYSELQQYLIQNPQAGEVIPGSRGVRKVRWARPGMGKRGGAPDHLFCSI